jgi:hypothetical protein
MDVYFIMQILISHFAFFSPLVKEMQRIIRDQFPDLWKFISENSIPNFPTIGGSIFQSIALNFRASTIWHRDVSDELPAWIYCFDSFTGGELSLPK